MESTGSQRSPQYPRETSGPSNYDYQATDTVFDFAAGFYGIKVHPDSQPYITFFIEGRGYFAYQDMPFGITGGPSEFGHVTGEHFHDLIAMSLLELFVDDGGMASNSFEEGIGKLRTLLNRVR